MFGPVLYSLLLLMVWLKLLLLRYLVLSSDNGWTSSHIRRFLLDLKFWCLIIFQVFCSFGSCKILCFSFSAEFVWCIKSNARVGYLKHTHGFSLFSLVLYTVKRHCSCGIKEFYLDNVVYAWQFTYCAQVLQIWLFIRSISFVVAGGTVIGVLVYPDLKSENFVAFILLILSINISGAVGVLSTLAGTILIEREWWLLKSFIFWILVIIYLIYKWQNSRFYFS